MKNYTKHLTAKRKSKCLGSISICWWSRGSLLLPGNPSFPSVGWTKPHVVFTLWSGASRMVNSQASSLPPSPRVCAGCRGKISERFLLFSMERYWHTRCLKCSCCQAQLGDIGSSCYSKGGMILCRSDYLRYGTHLEEEDRQSPNHSWNLYSFCVQKGGGRTKTRPLPPF